MKVGCVREVKSGELRVALTPEGAREYAAHGHKVIVETGAGIGAGFLDGEYEDAGAAVSQSAEDVWAACDMVVKVKEPLAAEYYLMREGQIVYAYLHLAAQKMLAYRMLRSKSVGVACETLTDASGGLPVLVPMSGIAGTIAVLEGMHYLLKPHGTGVLSCGSPGVARANVCVLGGGTAGISAAKTAVGMGARTVVLDINPAQLAQLDALFGSRIDTLYASPAAVERQVCAADLVIGAVLVPGAAAPKLIPRAILKNMRPGCVFADIAVDQGGCAESTRPTTLEEPTFVVDGVLHYCVANIPAAVPKTSAPAFCNAALPFGLKIADMGIKAAAKADPGIKNAVNTFLGKCTHKTVAEALEAEYTDLMSLI